jgi:hypothetical protein
VRVITLEQINEASIAETHVGLALGGGTLLLPLLAPDAWLLPYDVVTVAWKG